MKDQKLTFELLEVVLSVKILYESSSSGMDLSAILLQINYFLNA